MIIFPPQTVLFPIHLLIGPSIIICHTLGRKIRLMLLLNNSLRRRTLNHLPWRIQIRIAGTLPHWTVITKRNGIPIHPILGVVPIPHRAHFGTISHLLMTSISILQKGWHGGMMSLTRLIVPKAIIAIIIRIIMFIVITMEILFIT